jgi:predicted anti-sigma-YlaC factor YlaD
MMRCRRLRDHYASGEPAADPRLAADLESHLQSCAGCGAFVERLAVARRILAEPRSVVLPDSGFPARVAARLPQPVEVLGWAALRLLPAAAVLLVALATYGQWRPPAVSDLWLLQPTPGQLLAWSLLPD